MENCAATCPVLKTSQGGTKMSLVAIESEKISDYELLNVSTFHDRLYMTKEKLRV